jgi:hypothetical protein
MIHECSAPAELLTGVAAMRDLPVMKAEVLKQGFYYNFQEFKNNAPGFPYDNEESLPKLLQLMNYTEEEIPFSSAIPDTMYWGFSDGVRLFIRDNFNFIQLEKHDAAWYVGTTLDYMRRAKNKKLWWPDDQPSQGIMSGMITGLLGLNKSYHSNPIPYIPVYFLARINMGLQLDWQTGEIMF